MNFLSNIFPSNKEKKQVENAVKTLTEQIKRQHSLYRKEIKEWKMARISALDTNIPRRDQLQLLYDDIMGDAFIWGKWENRKLRISNRSVNVESDGVINEDKTKLLKTLWFNNFIKHYIDSKAFGYSLIYPKELTEDGYIKELDIVYRTNIVPETKEILKYVYDQKGQKFNEPPLKEWCLFFEDATKLGLLDKAAPLWIFKKHSWQNWDEFEEMFGVPIRIAKLASDDKRVQDEVKKWLQSLGSAAYGIFNEGTDIEIIESKSKDAFNVFNEKRKAANEELAILIDGQFESSTETGSNAKAGVVIENTQGEITKDDATMTLFAINEVLIPFLIERGYPFTEADEVVWNENMVSDPQDRLAIFKGVKDLGYSVKKEQIESELDVELDEVAPPPTPPSNLHPTNFKQPHAHIGCGAHLETYRIINLEITNQLTNDEEELLRRLWNNRDSINWDYKEFMATHGDLISAVRSGYGEIDFDFESTDHLTVEAFQNNIHRFGTDKTQKEIYDLNKIIKDPSVDTPEKFYARAKKVFPNYKRTWANTEVEQAHASSQAAASYHRYMKNADIAPFWQYKTVADDRVRPEHWALHNKVFRKDDASSWEFMPPNGFKCRCDDIELIDYEGEVSGINDAIGADPDGYEKMKKSGHAVNWGDAKQAFTATQSYLHGLPLDALDVTDFDFTTFGLSSVSTLIKRNLIGTGKIDFKKFTDRSGLAKFNTVEELPVWLNKEKFDTINPDFRHKIPEVLNTPDEIFWYEQGDGFVKSYFKHYKDGSLNALVTVGTQEKATLNYFANLKNADEFRRGLLVYTPELHIEQQLKLYNSYDADFIKEQFNTSNGGFLAIHKGHAKIETKANKEIALQLAKKGKGIALMDNIENVKSFDAEINGIGWEFKTLTNYKNLEGAIDTALRDGAKQAANILLHINGNYTTVAIYKGISRRVNRNRKIEFVAILFNDGRLLKFSRKQIETGEFAKVLKK